MQKSFGVACGRCAVAVVVCTSVVLADEAVSPDGDPIVERSVILPAESAAVRLGDHPDVAGHAPTRLGGAAPFVLTGSLPEGDAPASAVFTPDGETIIVAHRESRNLILWDADTRAFLGEIVISGLPQDVDVTPDGLRAIVASIDDSISIVDLGGMAETTVLPAAENPGAVAVSPAGDLAAVGLAVSGQIVVIDLGSNTIVRTINGIGFSQIISFSAEAPAGTISYSQFAFIDDDRVFNLDLGGSAAQFIDVRTGVVNDVPIAASPAGFAISGDGTRAVVAHSGTTRTITSLDLALESVINTIPTTDNLSGPIAANIDGSLAAAAILNAVRIYDTGTAVAGPALGTASVSQLLVTPDNQHVLGVGFRGSVISFASGTIVDEVNNQVSTSLGAMSPVDPRAALFSTTFGDDMVVVNADGASGFLEAFQLSGPLAEGDRCRTVAVSPDGSTVVGVSIFSDTATVVDSGAAFTTGNGPVATGFAPIGQRPSAVVITPDNTRAVVGNLDSTFASIVDLATATTTNVPISRRAGSVAISPDSTYAYLGVVADGDGVWRINLNTNSVEGPRLFTGNMGGVGYSFSQTSQIALSPDGFILAVAGSFTNNVTLIDTAAWSVITSVPVGTFPTWFGWSADSQRLFVSNRNADTISEIDVTIPAVVRTIPVGDQPWHIVVTDDAVYVHDWGSQAVRRINRVTGLTSGIQPLPERGVGLDLDPLTGDLIATVGTASTALGGTDGFVRTQSGSLLFLDPDSLAEQNTVDLGKGPSAAAVSANGNTFAAAAPIGDGVVIVGRVVCAADLNGDGVVDSADLSVLVGSFGMAVPPGTAGDINGDGIVDSADLSVLVGEFACASG